MSKELKKWTARYIRDETGQFIVMFALFALPLVLIMGYVIDLNKALGKKTSISAALDAAALAAVIPANLTQGERAAYADEVFRKNYFGDVPVQLQIQASREQVSIVGTSSVSTLIGGVAGMDAVQVKDTATAVLTRSDIICVLALDPTGERAIEFKDKAVFNSPACSVQVNSTHDLAIVSDVVIPPIAHSFCVGGISRGEFLPLIKHACSPVADPYAKLTPPEDGPCVDVKKLKGNNDSVQIVGALDDIVGTDTVLEPGTYCKGLKIEGVNIRFSPGTYIIKGKLEFKKYAAAVGNNVTLILSGKKGTLSIEGDAQVSLKAPSTGPYAGVVFYQIPDIKKLGKKAKLPTGKSQIKSGGGLRIIGTAYFPTQQLIITSDSSVVSQSPATSFIAYRLEFGGKSNTEIHVDHETGGIPPLLPRSDEGARLIE